MAEEILQRLAETPLTKLRIGEARFRRELASLGYSSIIDVLNLPLKTVDEKLTLDASEQLDKLRDKFREDPVAFGRKVLPQSNTDATPHVFSAPNSSSALPVMPTAIHAEGPNPSPATRRHAPTAHLAEKTHKTYYHQDAIVIAPKDKYFERLRELEGRARNIFDDLEDRHEVVMVHMAFDELAVELDCIRDDFKELFSRHRGNHREALSLIDGYLRNIYLVYLADRARELFDGEKLWPYVFDEIDVTGQNVQIEMKRLFVNQLDHWPKMPRYAEDESDFYYLYTVLMHGGLSESLWGDLWRKSVLPFCDELFKSNSHYSSYETVALELLDSVKNPESRLSPSNSVRRIFQKVPDISVSRLLSSALNVAAQATNCFNSTSNLQMLSSSGLPDTAMIALKKVLSRPKDGQKNAPRSSRDGFVYIPNAKLSLDISSGKALIAWPALMLPSNLAGSVIEYWVNGDLVHKETVQYSVGKSKLEAVRIPVRPSAKYSVELRLIGNPSSNEALTGSLQQSIQRTHPGCFEFILAKNGSYQLRGIKERLTKRRTVAYLVEEKLEVVPLGGMTPGSIYETDDSWGEARVQFFTVEPGASGMIVNRKTRNEIAVCTNPTKHI